MCPVQASLCDAGIAGHKSLYDRSMAVLCRQVQGSVLLFVLQVNTGTLQWRERGERGEREKGEGEWDVRV